MSELKNLAKRKFKSYEDLEELMGQTVYVSPGGGSFYKARLLGYGAYGHDKNHKTYCVLVESANIPFVDYFKEVFVGIK